MEKLFMQQIAIHEALAQFDNLPDSAYIRLPVIKRLYGVSSATIWRGVKQGNIPKPNKLSERCTAWRVGLIRADLAQKAGGVMMTNREN